MAIVLRDTSRLAKTSYQGETSVALLSGKTIKIEWSPQGEEILSFTADKDYTVSVTVNINEA